MREIECSAGSLKTLKAAITALDFLKEVIVFKLEGSCPDKMARSSPSDRKVALGDVTSSWTCFFSNSLHLATGHMIPLTFQSSPLRIKASTIDFSSSDALQENSESGAISKPRYHM